MSQPAQRLTAGDDAEEALPRPVLSPPELRRLVVAASVTGKQPAEFLHDSVMAAVEAALANDGVEDADDASAALDAPLQDLSSELSRCW